MKKRKEIKPGDQVKFVGVAVDSSTSKYRYNNGWCEVYKQTADKDLIIYLGDVWYEISRRQVTHIKRKKQKIDKKAFCVEVDAAVEALKQDLFNSLYIPKVQPRFVGWSRTYSEGMPLTETLTKKDKYCDCAVFIIPENELTEEVRKKWNIK